MAGRSSLNNALAKIESSNASAKRKFVPNVAKALAKQTTSEIKPPENCKLDKNTPSKKQKKQFRVKDETYSQSRYVQSYSIFESGVGCVVKNDKSNVDMYETRSGGVNAQVVNETMVKELLSTESRLDPEFQADSFVTDVKQVFIDKPMSMSDFAATNPPPLDPHKVNDLTNGRSRRTPYNLFDEEGGSGRLFTLQLPDKILPQNLDDVKESRLGKIQLLDNGCARLVIGDAKFDLISAKRRGTTSDVVIVDEGASADAPVQLTCLGHLDETMAAVPNLRQFTRLGR